MCAASDYYEAILIGTPHYSLTNKSPINGHPPYATSYYQLNAIKVCGNYAATTVQIPLPFAALLPQLQLPSLNLTVQQTHVKMLLQNTGIAQTWSYQ